jgi:putative DNA primase/helicase
LRARLRKAWRGSAPVAAGDPVATYLACRGVALVEFPRALRTAPALAYWHKVRDAGGQPVPRKLGSFNAMLALVQGPDGEARTLHVTFIANGRKAGVPKPRKFLSALAQLSGAAVRLYAPGETLAIAEGIETALAVRLLTGLPVWAALNERLMRSMVLPREVHQVHIFADRDRNRVGEEAARELGERMQRQGRAVRIALPRKAGEDFLDVLNRRPGRAAA